MKNGIAITSLLLLISSVSFISSVSAADTVATVNGIALTAQDLQVWQTLYGLPDEPSPSVRAAALDQLIDHELIRQFLERHKTVADPEQLTTAVRGMMERDKAQRMTSEPNARSLGIDEKRLAAVMAVPIAWRQHVARVITEQQIRNHFEEHRPRLDGTRLRVSQIFRQYEVGESISRAPRSLAALDAVRRRIASGDAAFTDAARLHSQAPTAKSGGDVGWIGPKGGLPIPVTQAAYQLEPGEVSEVILSPFGAHLVLLTDVEPGDLSLEDARPVILAELSQSLWAETVAAERKTAKIEKGS